MEFDDGPSPSVTLGDSKARLTLPSGQSYSSFVLIPLLTFAVRRRCLLVGGPGRGKTASAILMGVLAGYPLREVRRAMQHGHPQLTIADLLGTPLPADLIKAERTADIDIAWRSWLSMRVKIIDEYNRIPTRTQSALLTLMSDGYAEVFDQIYEVDRLGLVPHRQRRRRRRHLPGDRGAAGPDRRGRARAGVQLAVPRRAGHARRAAAAARGAGAAGDRVRRGRARPDVARRSSGSGCPSRCGGGSSSSPRSSSCSSRPASSSSTARRTPRSSPGWSRGCWRGRDRAGPGGRHRLADHRRAVGARAAERAALRQGARVLPGPRRGRARRPACRASVRAARQARRRTTRRRRSTSRATRPTGPTG